MDWVGVHVSRAWCSSQLCPIHLLDGLAGSGWLLWSTEIHQIAPCLLMLFLGSFREICHLDSNYGGGSTTLGFPNTRATDCPVRNGAAQQEVSSAERAKLHVYLQPLPIAGISA